MRITSRRFNEALREAKQLLNAIDPELTVELNKEIKAKIIRKLTWGDEPTDQLDKTTIKNLVYSLLIQKYLDKNKRAIHNDPYFKPRYWLKRCEFMNSQEQKNLS